MGVEAAVDTPKGNAIFWAKDANTRSAPGLAKLHMPMGAMPKGMA